MQRGRLGGIPLPRTFPIRDGGIRSMMVRPPAVIPGRAGTVWRCPMLSLREGAPQTQPPKGPPPREEVKNKR